MGIRVDLGCGKNKEPNCIGVDIHAGNKPDIVADVRFAIPELKNGCADFVYCKHVLEHLEDEEWRMVMQEIARLLHEEGEFEIRVPHPSCANAMIQGHRCVLTPFYWQQIRDGNIKLKLPLVIEEIEEIPNPACVEFCKRNKLKFEEFSHFLFDAFYETRIKGRYDSSRK